MSAPEPEKPKLPFVLLKEFYRVFLLGLSVFFAYFLVSRSQIFSMENTVRDWAIRIIYLLAALLAATIFIKSLNVFFWEGYREKKKLPKVPNLLRQGLNVIVYGATTLFVLQTVFQVSVSGLLTATGAMGVVIGLALKEMISDVFSGLMLSLDRTIKIGDYVRIESRPAEPKVGVIAQMNWRTVHLHTPENVLVVIPNTFLTANIITNLSEPSDTKEFELMFTFDFDVSSERIIRVLNSALYQTTQILQDPEHEPKTRISRVNGTGVEYKVKYWLIPSKCGPGKARNFVINNVLYCLNQSGLQLSYPKSDVFNAGMPTRNLDIREDRIGLLGKIELFDELTHEEIAGVSMGIIERKVKKGDFIVRMGEEGNSMFLLVEGLLNVIILDKACETEVKVAMLKSGNYFGEMSLLTGEPRSASISAFCDSLLFEIPKDSITKILRDNPCVVEAFSSKIAENKLRNETALANKTPEEKEKTKKDLSSSILGRIMNFFRL
ncbi:MAG: mechanosensitive ion channel family protein [Spirochaetota bacterium]